jgi:hypothetical protein
VGVAETGTSRGLVRMSAVVSPTRSPKRLAARFAAFSQRLLSNRTAWLLLLLIIPAMLPLAAPGYFFKAHDGQHSVSYLVEFDQAIRDGLIWPIWGPDYAVGFGYPVWLVYAPLAYFVAEFFHLLGFGLTAAVKLTWALGFLLGAAGMYRLARRWWGPAAGLIAALAFTYAPYHLVQIYVRGALAEFLALAWFPWVLLAFVALWDDPRPGRAAWAAMALGTLMLTHSQAPVMYVPFLAGFVLFKAVTYRPPAGSHSVRTRLKPLLWAGVAFVLGGLLGSIFMVPLLLERRFIAELSWLHDTYYYGRHFVYPSQFFNPFWGFGYSVEGTADGMSFQLGLLQVLGAAVGALAALSRSAYGTRRLPHRLDAIFLVVVSLVAVFAMTPAAKSVWDALPLVNLLQFPWRLLALTTVSLALLAGAGASWLRDSAQDYHPDPEETTRSESFGSISPYVYVVGLVIVLASFPYTRPELVPIRPQDESPLNIIEFEAKHPDMRGMTRWSERLPVEADSPLPAQYLAGEPLARAAIVAGQGTVREQESSSASAFARVQADSPVRLRFYTHYFPGWRATVDGQPVEIQPDAPNGLIGLDLPAGEHQVQLRFTATPVRSVGAALSIVALLIIAVLWVVDPRRRNLHE